jgi:hypothetical protein
LRAWEIQELIFYFIYLLKIILFLCKMIFMKCDIFNIFLLARVHRYFNIIITSNLCVVHCHCHRDFHETDKPAISLTKLSGTYSLLSHPHIADYWYRELTQQKVVPIPPSMMVQLSPALKSNIFSLFVFLVLKA